MLDAAYAYCDQLTKAYSRTFDMASGLLPPEKRRATRALYAFCRVSDNLVDSHDGPGDPREDLVVWREHILTPRLPADNPVAMAWSDTRARYGIPWRYAEQLINGVACDLQEVRYANFEQLAEYCYLVASTVGLMAMHIIGFHSADAIPYAVRLGVALQLTNILRDVAEDWQDGRLYLPRDELARFGLEESDIESGVVDDRWRDFMRFQIQRNRRLYAESLPGIAYLDADGRFAIAAAAELYQGILHDIEAHDYDVFTRRAHLSTWGKLRRLPGIWWRSKMVESAP
jgi:phytoene synthase